jgi:hypothetical protein
MTPVLQKAARKKWAPCKRREQLRLAVYQAVKMYSHAVGQAKRAQCTEYYQEFFDVAWERKRECSIAWRELAAHKESHGCEAWWGTQTGILRVIHPSPRKDHKLAPRQ